MSYQPVRLTSIPNALVASSVIALRRLMLSNNKKHGKWFKYDIVWNTKDNKWYAWYVDEIGLTKLPKNLEERSGE